jgi:hypothetical protein
MTFRGATYRSASQYRSPYAGRRNPFHRPEGHNQQKEAPMGGQGSGRKAREPKPDAEAGEGTGISGEYAGPDAAKAFDIYDKQIKPKLAKMDTLKGDLSQPYDDIKSHANFPRKVLNFIIALEAEEDAKRDHMMLALSEGLKHRKLFLPTDLVSMANGEAGGSVIPTEDREDDALSGLDQDDEDDDFTESSEEELAAQEGRGEKSKAAAGTGAAAIEAMKGAAAQPAAVTH